MFQLTEDQLNLQELVRDFSENTLRPKAESLDKSGAYPAEAIASLAEMGVMGLNIPEEYEGAAMDEVCKVLGDCRNRTLLRR